MKYNLATAMEMVDQMDAIIAKLENKGTLNAIDEEMIHDLLFDFRAIMCDAEVKF